MMQRAALWPVVLVVLTVVILPMCLAQSCCAESSRQLPWLRSHTPAPAPRPASPATAIAETASAQVAQAAVDADTAFINQVLQLLGEVVITRLDARVSLESATVEAGRIRLEGVLLRNLEVGLLLNARGARRLAEIVQQRYGRGTAGAPASSGNSAQANEWTQLLEIAKLGLYDRLEVAVRLRELRVRRLSLDAEALDVQGLLLQVGATPNDPATGKPRSDTLEVLLDVLRRTALTRIKAHAGLDKLAARRLDLDLEGVALQGLSVGILLARQNDNSPDGP